MENKDKVFCGECCYFDKRRKVYTDCEGFNMEPNRKAGKTCHPHVYLFYDHVRKNACLKFKVFSADTTEQRSYFVGYGPADHKNARNGCKDFKYKRKKCRTLEDVEVDLKVRFNIKDIVKRFSELT